MAVSWHANAGWHSKTKSKEEMDIIAVVFIED
jgi:hypothetical protein